MYGVVANRVIHILALGGKEPIVILNIAAEANDVETVCVGAQWWMSDVYQNPMEGWNDKGPGLHPPSAVLSNNLRERRRLEFKIISIHRSCDFDDNVTHRDVTRICDEFAPQTVYRLCIPLARRIAHLRLLHA